MPLDNHDIRSEKDIQQLLSRMPKAVSDTFSDEQLTHLKTAIGGRQWGKHAFDVRGTFQFPFMRWRYYYVILFGRNRRQLSDRERRISTLVTTLLLIGFIGSCTLIGLLMLYLLKSFAGIDLFPGFSLGVWDYFKSEFR